MKMVRKKKKNCYRSHSKMANVMIAVLWLEDTIFVFFFRKQSDKWMEWIAFQFSIYELVTSKYTSKEGSRNETRTLRSNITWHMFNSEHETPISIELIENNKKVDKNNEPGRHTSYGHRFFSHIIFFSRVCDSAALITIGSWGNGFLYSSVSYDSNIKFYWIDKFQIWKSRYYNICCTRNRWKCHSRFFLSPSFTHIILFIIWPTSVLATSFFFFF